MTDITISVYVDYGAVYEYEVSSVAKAREHADAIIKKGFRCTVEGSDDLVWIPPHRIDKIVAPGAGETTKYKTKERAT